MLAYYTPAPIPPMIRNVQLDELQKNHQYEIVTFPFYLPDEICIKQLARNPDPNVILYIAIMKGITPIITIAGHKSFIADLSQRKKSNLSQLMFQNPSYSNTEQVEKHLRDQRDSA